MAKSVTLTCDCGCEATVVDTQKSGWFILDQDDIKSHGSDPKLERKLHFSSLQCLATWSDKAAKALPGLQNGASGLTPRGRMVTKSVIGLYV